MSSEPCTWTLDYDGGILLGLYWDHKCPSGGVNPIAFDIPENHYIPEMDKWTIESVEPLTISPSLLCRMCQRHGFIRDGKWVEA